MADQNYNINIITQVNGADDSTNKVKDLNKEVNNLEKSSGGLGSKLKGLSGDLKGLSGSAEEAFASVKNIAGAFTGVAGVAAGLAAAVGAVAVALIANGAAMAALADENDELAQKMGVTTTRLAELKLIASENGGSVEGLNRVYDKLSKSLNKLEEDNLKSINSFRALGLSQQDLAGLSEREIAGKVIKNWEAMGRSSQATAAVIQLLGASFRDQIPAIKAAADAGQEYSERIKKYGGVASEALVKAGAELEKAKGNLSQVLTETRNIFAEFFAGSLADAAQWSADFGNNINKALRTEASLLRANSEMKKNLSKEEFDEISRLAEEKAIKQLGFLKGSGLMVQIPFRVEEYNKRANESLNIKEGLAEQGGMPSYLSQAEIDNENRRLANRRGVPVPLAPLADPNKRDPFKDALTDMMRQVELSKEATVYEKTLFETQKGRFKDLNDGQKQQLLDLAKKEDFNNKIEKQNKEEIADYQAMDKLKKEAIADLNRQISLQDKFANKTAERLKDRGNSAINAFAFQRNTSGMSSDDKEVFRAMTENAEFANRAIAELNSELAGYNERVAKIRNEEAGVNNKIKQAAEDRKKYQSEWLNGAKEAFSEYKDVAENVAAQTKDVFSNAFKGAEDAMTQFILTGKMNFKDFAKSIIADVARMYAKMVVLWAIQQAVGFFGGGAQASFSQTSLGSSGFGSGLAYGNQDLGGNFADGGDPPVGKVSVVGERGPELFVPKTAGTIVPNNMIGGKNVTIQNTIAVSIGSVDSTEREQALLRTMDEKIRVITYESVGELMRDGNALSMVRR